MTERRACRLANQPRGTQRYRAIQREDEDALTQAIVQLASQYGRYGYRRITALLRRAGWRVGKDRVERIWRREGLKVPQKQKPRGRLWLNDGSCVRLRPERRNHVWSYDFVSARTHDGRSVRLLNLIDEHTRESLLVRAERRWSSSRVISALADVMVMKGVPEHLRSDNGPEFVAKDLRKWLAKTGAKTLYIEPGSPWENGYCESFNSKLRDEFLNGEIFYSMKELRVLAERWRVHYNTIRPHSSLGYRSPAPEAWLTNSTGHGEVETATRFPLLHTPDGGYLNSENSCVTLTHPTAQRIGHSSRLVRAVLPGLPHHYAAPGIERPRPGAPGGKGPISLQSTPRVYRLATP
jgi:putative transposase